MNRMELFLVYEDGVARYAVHARKEQDAIAVFTERAEGLTIRLTATCAQFAPLPDLQRVTALMQIEAHIGQMQMLAAAAAEQARAAAVGLHLPGRKM